MKRLKVGIVGLRRGRTFVTQFDALPETEVAAVCDLDDGAVEAALKSLKHSPNARGFDDLQEMISRDLDIVAVCTGAPDHVDHCCAAMDAGKHVLSEVPAAVTLEGSRRLVRTVRRTGRKYMMAENCCWWGFIREYRRQVRSGRIGEVLYAEGEYVHDVRHLYLTNPVLGPDAPFEERLHHPESKRTWRAGLHPVIYLTHDIGPLLEILDDRCRRVCAMAAPSACGEGFAPAAETALFKTEKGRVIKFMAAFSLPRPGHHWFVLMGTKGSIESPRGPASKHLLFVEGENMEGWSEMSWSTRLLSGPREAWSSGHGGADWHVSREFADCVLNDGPPPIDVYRSLDYTLPGICAAESVRKDGVPVDIPDPRDFS